MKKINCVFLAAICMLLCCSCESSCGEMPKGINIAVIGNVNNSASFAPDQFSELMTDLCSNGGEIAWIVPDSSPSIDKEIKVPRPSIAHKAEETAAANSAKLSSIYSEKIFADSEESMLLESMYLAANWINSRNNNNDSYIIICHSGLSTTGILMDYINSPADKVISMLAEAEAIPSGLESTTVIWYGLGQVTDPQPQPTKSTTEQMKELFTGLLSTAKEVRFSTLPLTGEANSEYYVTPVNVPDLAIEFPITDTAAKSNEIFFDDGSDTIYLDDTKVQFEANTAILKNEAEFIFSDELQNVISYLQSDTENSINIYGTTAHYGAEETAILLSEERAERIKDIIVASGNVDPDKISTKGLGYSSHYYINDLNPDGTLNEDIASKNRLVIICMA